MGNDGDENLHTSGEQKDTKEPQEIPNDSVKAKIVLKILLSEDGRILFQTDNVGMNKQFLINACLEVIKSLHNFKEPETVIKAPEFMTGLRRFLKK